MEGIEEGIFDDITDLDYHYGKYRKCLSNSGYKQLAKSALHFKTWRDRESDIDKDHFTFGKAYHVYILEPKTFGDRFHVIPKMTRSMRNGEPAGEWKKAMESAGNKTVLWEEDLEKIRDMKRAFTLNKSALAILQNPGKYERTYIWKDPNYGIWCKCRLDIDIENIAVIGDLKSTQAADPWGFPKSVANFGYDLQASHYTRGVDYLTGKPHSFVFVAQEKEEPYASCVFQIDHGTIINAAEKIDPLMQCLAKALRTGVWEAYPDEVISLEMPGWYK